MQTYKVVSHDIPLGHRWEHHARRIVFDISAWVESFGPGTVQLLHQRQGDEYPYPVTVTRTDADGETVNDTTGTLVRWDVTNTDTAQVCRYGKAELRYYRGTQISPEFLAKSDIYRTTVENALGGALATPPEESPDWLATLLDAANSIDDQVSGAVSAAQGYAESAEQSAADAASAAENAGQYAAAAENAAQDAATAAADAERFAASTESTAAAALPTIYQRSFHLDNGLPERLDGIQYIANDGATVGVQATVPLIVTTTASGNAETGWTNLSDATVMVGFENDGEFTPYDYVQTLDSGNHILNVQAFFTVSGSSPHTFRLALMIDGGYADILPGTVVSLSGVDSSADEIIEEPPII
ncbi:MAG: hypothetical protein IKR84_01730 [Oscillibacter sp.]|nr:hypothetical protein [Oscillibacter sp.]